MLADPRHVKLKTQEFGSSYRTLEVVQNNLRRRKTDDIPITITDSDEDHSSPDPS